MAMVKKILTHTFPLLRKEANYLKILPAKGMPFGYSHEQIWLKKLKNSKYSVCCVPYLLYDLCIGDTIKFDNSNKGYELVASAGRYGFRAVFDIDKILGNEVLMKLKESSIKTNIEYETYLSLIAIDVKDIKSAREYSGFLRDLVKESIIVEYETIRMKDI